MPNPNKIIKNPDGKHSRRDFLTLSAVTAGVVGVGAVAVQFLNSMNPAADVEALASLEVDVSSIKPGESKTIMWRGKPVFSPPHRRRY